MAAPKVTKLDVTPPGNVNRPLPLQPTPVSTVWPDGLIPANVSVPNANPSSPPKPARK